MVLLHGFASTFAHNWRETGWGDILADFGCTAPAIDLPGHGSSAPLTDPLAYAELEEDLFRSMRPNCPLSAVGFSAGGDLLLRVALAHPDHFEKIVLLGVGDNVFESKDPSTAIAALDSPHEPDDVQARLFRRLAHAAGNDPKALSAFLRRSRQPLRDEDLSTLACPVLVVLGDRDTIKSADRLVATLPSASLVTLPGVDHSPRLRTSGRSMPP
jgi:pimeloyl-ACP methyl ester carboxylesterase